VFGAGTGEVAAAARNNEGAYSLKDPYLPMDGHLELRPDRSGRGVEMDEELLGTEECVQWGRKLPVKSDGSIG